MKEVLEPGSEAAKVCNPVCDVTSINGRVRSNNILRNSFEIMILSEELKFKRIKDSP
jgi:hypothetical protein